MTPRTSCTSTDLKCHCFNILSDTELKLINEHAVYVNYTKGETILKQGTFASHVMIMEKGIAKVYVEGSSDSLILKIIPEGNILGLTSLSDNSAVFQYSAVAYVDSVVKLIDINIFKQLVRQNADFAVSMIDILSANNIQIYGRFFSLTHKQSYGRLADILLCLSERIFKKDTFEFPLTRKDLAELAGMSTENVIRIMKKFKEDKLIETDLKQISLTDKNRLKQISLAG